MRNRKSKIIPYSVYDVSAMEGWLEEMARKGLHLDVLTGQYAWFEKGEPAEVRYRMEPWAGDVPRLDDEMEAVYEAAGWEYVQRVVDEHFHIWRSVRPDARELHDDPIVRSFGFDWAVKRATIRFLLVGVIFLVLMGIIVGDAWYEAVRPWPYPWIEPERSLGKSIVLNFLTQLHFVVLGLCLSLWVWTDLTSARRVWSTLRDGVPLEQRGKGVPYRRVIFWGGLLLYAVIMAMNLWLLA